MKITKEKYDARNKILLILQVVAVDVIFIGFFSFLKPVSVAGTFFTIVLSTIVSALACAIIMGTWEYP